MAVEDRKHAETQKEGDPLYHQLINLGYSGGLGLKGHQLPDVAVTEHKRDRRPGYRQCQNKIE